MGSFDVRGGELKKLIKLAKKQPVAFAYNPGSSPKDDYFGMDRRKPAKMVGKAAKDEGVGTKAAFGTALVEDKVLSLTCIKTVPSIAKKLKKYLLSEKVLLNVQVLDDSGKILEAEIQEDLPDDPGLAEGDVSQQAETSEQQATQPENSQPEQKPAPQRDTSELHGQLKALGGRIQTLEPDTAKLFAKHYKQLLELFKAEQFQKLEAGLAKVGQALDRLSSAPKATPESEDPNKTKWDALQPKIQVIYEKAIAASPAAAEKLTAAWAQVIALAKDGEFGKALTVAKQLVPALQKLAQATPVPEAAAKPEAADRQSETQKTESGDVPSERSGDNFEEVKQTLIQRLSSMEQALVVARRVLPDQSSPIDKLTAVITGLEDKTGLAAARKAANDLQRIADLGAERATQITAALEEVDRVRGYILQMGQEFEVTLGDTPPARLSQPLDNAKDKLPGEDEIDPVKIGQTVEEAMRQLEKSEKEIAQLLAEKAAWEAQLDLFEPRVTALANHNKKNEEPVKARIKTITDGLAAAKALAGKHKYKEAEEALPPLAKTCAEAEKYADACSQYALLFTDRKKRVTDLLVKYPLGGPIHDLVKGTIRKIKEDFDAAEAKGTANPPEYAVAMKTLVPMATRAQEAMWRGERAEAYASKVTFLNGRVTEREKHPDAAEIKQFIAQMKKLIADADVVKTKSFIKSLSLLERASNLNNTLFAAAKRSKDFKAAFGAAKQNIKDLKTHAGHLGITKHTSRLDTNLAAAKTKGEEAKFLHGQKICEAITAEFNTLKGLASDYKAYLDGKTALKLSKDAWDQKYIGKVSGLTDQVTVLEGKASDAVAKEEYKLAKKHIDEAKKVADLAKTEADVFAQNAGYVSNVKTTIQSGSGDFSAVISSVESFKTALDGLDKDNLYTSEISDAVKPVQTAQGMIGQTPQDDTTIKGELESARSQLADLLDKVVQHSVYKNARSRDKSSYDAITTKDRGEALKTETDVIGKVFEDAKQQAETSKDPAAAIKEIAKLAALLKDLERKSADFDAYDLLLKGDIKLHNDWFDAADGAYGKPKDVLDKEFTEYGKQKTAAETDATSKKWKDARAKLAKAKETADLYKKIFADFKRATDEKKKWITDRLSPVDTTALVKPQYDAMKPKLEKIDKLISERQYDQAIALCLTVKWDIYRAQDTITRHTAIKPKRDAAGEAVQKLFEVRCSPIEADYVRAKRQLDLVDAEIAANTYPNAMKIVDAIAPMCLDPIRIGKEYAEYKPIRDAADEAVRDLGQDYPQDDTVALQLKRLSARLSKLNSAEAKRTFAALKDVAQAIANDTAKVAASAKTQASLGEAAQQMKDTGPTETKDFDKHLQAMRDALATLKSHEGKECQQVKDHTARIERLLSEADQDYNNDGDIMTARGKLSNAASSIARGNLLGEQFVLLNAEVKALETRHSAEKVKHSEPTALKGLFDACARNILSAKGAVGQGSFNTAMNFVTAAEEPLDKAVAIGTGHATYKTRRDEVKPRVDALISHKAHFSVADDVDEARLYLSAAEEMANALNPKEALEKLKTCEKICNIAEVKADMHANEEPSEDKIKKLLETKDGMKELDEIFEALDPSVKRKACKKVLEMRFGMQLKQTTDKAGSLPDTNLEAMAPNVTRLFSLMADLDEGHTSQNPSMALVQRFGTEKGTSSFGKSYNNKRMTKNIELRIGRAEMPEETVIGQEWQLGAVDEECKPVDDTPAKSFNWTTLHEIGHAVDDKYGVMKRNGSNKKYGGWKEHGGDVSEVADQAAKHFKYDKSYIASYLSKPGGNYARPEPPGGTEADEWDQRRLNAEAWCDSIRSDKTIWYSATETKRLQIGGRVFQESYSGKWVSYDFSARSQGVRGYQFRASGEWFADIYAAFHSGKMNPKHPAREWLEKDMSN